MPDPDLDVQDVIDDLDGVGPLAAETHRRAAIEAALAG
jgi:hypothetical protein